MWIVRLALRRPYTVATLCLVVALMGALAVGRMRVDVLPTIDIPVVVVIWNYNGLPAEEMERRIVFLSERAYSTSVGGIEHIESQSINSIGVIRIYFEQGSDIGSAISQITSTSAGITRIMPPGTTPPVVLQYNASNVPVAQLTMKSPTMTEQQLYDYGLNFIRLRLFTIPGLSTPAPYGGSTRQVNVDLDPKKLAASGLSPTDVVNAVAASNVILPAGEARLGSRAYDVRLNGSPVHVEDFNAIPLKVVGGRPVLLGDVAHVYDGFATQQNVVRVDGTRATYMSILRKANSSTLAVVDAVRDVIPQIKAAAPEGLELKIEFDQSIFVRAAIGSVVREGLVAAALVSLMVLGFLGSVRSVALVCTSIPVAIVVGIIGLFLTGQTLNVMTLGGLALAIGMLVDDATVAVENINRNHDMGKRALVAILDGSREVAVPALAATLTICIVFFPVVLLTGPAKFLFIPLAIAVVCSMLASYVLSRTLVPALAHLLMRDEKPHRGREGSLWRRFNDWRDERYERFRASYARALDAALHHRRLVLVCGALVTASAAFLPFLVGLDFFPAVDTGEMRMHFRAPIGTRLEDTERVVDELERNLRAIIPADELEAIDDTIGLPTSYNLGFVQSDSIGSQDADVFVALKPGHKTSTFEYMQRIRSAIPSAMPGTTLYFQPASIIERVLNFGLSAPIDVQIEGQNVEANADVARALAARMRRIAGAADVRIAQVFDHPAIDVRVDRQKAALVGLTEKDVAASLLTSLTSSFQQAPSFWVDPKNNVNYIVAVQTPIVRFETLGDVMTTPLGGAQYLGNVAQTSVGSSRPLISHYTVQPILDVQCGVAGRDLGGVSGDVRRAIADLGPLPRGTQIHVRGQTETMRTAFTNLGLGLIVAIALVYLLMVILFQSWLDPLIILVAVPGALVGILWMLAITGTTLNVESLMGAIMAVGIATSNSILLVSFANDYRVAEGCDARRAALEAGSTRLRPVIMTALAMILGMLPMALAWGEGGEQNAPLGRAVIGGLVVATFVTLFVVPVVYSLLRTKEPRKHALDEQFAKEVVA